MASYRLFFIDRERIEYAASFEANDDLAAAQVVRKRQYGRVGELWNLERFVGRYEPGTGRPDEVCRP